MLRITWAESDEIAEVREGAVMDNVVHERSDPEFIWQPM